MDKKQFLLNHFGLNSVTEISSGFPFSDHPNVFIRMGSFDTPWGTSVHVGQIVAPEDIIEKIGFKVVDLNLKIEFKAILYDEFHFLYGTNEENYEINEHTNNVFMFNFLTFVEGLLK